MLLPFVSADDLHHTELKTSPKQSINSLTCPKPLPDIIIKTPGPGSFQAKHTYILKLPRLYIKHDYSTITQIIAY